MDKNHKILVTHSGSFHSDDIFASATLSLYLEKNNTSFEIIRTRDLEIIEKGDFVFDVGGVYDEGRNRFDHHQKGGAGFRVVNDPDEVSVEYASFGLVWKKFGSELSGGPARLNSRSGGEKEAKIIDRRLVAPIDAIDNGFELVQNKYDISPYSIQDAFISMRPNWQEDSLVEDEMFLKCVEMAKVFLTREIAHANSAVIAEERVLEIYKNTKDKRILVLDQSYPYEYTLKDFSEPLFVISQRKTDLLWGVKAVKEDPKTFKNRKDFPASWGGLLDQDLQNITGVPDAVFCHKGLFLAVAKSKEGALKLAELSLK